MMIVYVVRRKYLESAWAFCYRFQWYGIHVTTDYIYIFSFDTSYNNDKKGDILSVCKSLLFITLPDEPILWRSQKDNFTGNFEHMRKNVLQYYACNYRGQPITEVLSATHYNNVIMDAMASQITSLTIVYSTVYPGTDQIKRQSSASLAFVRRIHRGPVNSTHKWPVTRKMFPFDDVIMNIAHANTFRRSQPITDALSAADESTASQHSWQTFTFYYM